MSEDKKKNSWEQKDGVLSGRGADFEIDKLFPDYSTGNAAQQFIMEYGIKQYLTDKTARSKDEKLSDAEAKDVMTEVWMSLVNGIVPAKKSSPLDKAETALGKAQADFDTILDNMVKAGIDKKTARSIADKSFGDIIKGLKAKRDSLIEGK